MQPSTVVLHTYPDLIISLRKLVRQELNSSESELPIHSVEQEASWKATSGGAPFMRKHPGNFLLSFEMTDSTPYRRESDLPKAGP